MPLDATAITIFPSDLNLVVIAFQRREAGGRKVQEPTLCMLNVFGEFLPDGFPQTLWWMHRSILRQAPVKAVDDAGLKVSQAEGCLYNGVWSSGV
ncbi:hypothetical protein DAI22_10g120300 [Oryza sativa Japonica Group]|nr:hypothetical protein DAI22_10g120300 [Oryza sativa Japonica Group]